MLGKQSKWSKDFPYILKHQRATLHLQAEPSSHTRQALVQLIERPLVAKRVSAPLDCSRSALFIKREQLDSLKKKWRIQRGNRKRNGMYDWTVEELTNTFEAHKRGARVPGVAGYGYTRSNLGLVDGVFFISRLLVGHVDGLTLIRRDPQATLRVIGAAFELLHSLHHQGVTHMDLWAANVMLPEQGQGLAQAIDLENGFNTPTAYFSETLGFQLGFFYYREIYRYITEADYDALVEATLVNYPGLDRAVFNRVYEISKHQHIDRLERRDIFCKGIVKSRW
ncbi:hypothetical protein [Pseudomonas sp. H9]|uniref:hypothetical protein n=1 Tax=Pseudomonas sp. H9 TaxID=483968 RepID=UPI0010576D3C|nr:hypothetical protein [Pseudomonas sp. H9]TDF80236.1 hypothetical protein E1573_19940 [Pseudomonas sp. H9]